MTLLIGSMSGDLYLNQLLGFLVEAPAIAATTLAIGRLGRRSTAAFLLLQGESVMLFPVQTRFSSQSTSDSHNEVVQVLLEQLHRLCHAHRCACCACRWHSMHAVCSDSRLASAGLCDCLQAGHHRCTGPWSSLCRGVVPRKCSVSGQPSLQLGKTSP